MRINKFMARQGIATRRDADDMIARGRVLLNGRIAQVGEKVDEGDVVSLRKGGLVKKFEYYAYNKPAEVITHSPQRGEKDVARAAGIRGVFPIGRLDKASDGLLILTNDGRVTDRLLNPEYDHEKEYMVTTRKTLSENFKAKMERGVKLEGGYFTKPCRVRILGAKRFSIILTEGKKHQIRNMVGALDNIVNTLTRTRVMNIQLGNLPENAHRQIVGEELETFLEAIGL